MDILGLKLIKLLLPCYNSNLCNIIAWFTYNTWCMEVLTKDMFTSRV